MSHVSAAEEKLEHCSERKVDQADVPRQIQQLLEHKHYDLALETAEKFHTENPTDHDASYLLMVSQRYAGQFEAALTTSLIVIQQRPEFGRAYQERGHVYMQLQNLEKSVDAYRQAVDLNAALMASWRGLASALRQLHRDEQAKQAFFQFKHLQEQDPVLVSIASMRNERKTLKAEQLCREFLQRKPHHHEAMRLLALIGMDLVILEEAEFLLESCLTLYPDFFQAKIDYVNVLHRRQRFDAAYKQTLQLIKALPTDVSVMTAHANACAAVGKHEEALTIYDELLDVDSMLHSIHLARGHALKTAGFADTAITAYQQAYHAKADFGDAYWSLANMKTYRFDENEIDAMKAQEAQPTTRSIDRIHMNFALGKAFEDKQAYAQSFEFYQRGNQLNALRCNYIADRNRLESTLQKQHCNDALFSHYVGCGHLAKDPIFIVGLPRAGSTLLEQILASHSMVEGTLELPNIPALAHRLNGRAMRDEMPRYPANLNELPKEKCQALGEQYLRDTEVHRSGAPFFIDKMPNNFKHIGLIHMILPNAKIIDARRHPLACCFSGYKQLFAEGQEFTYRLEDIADYYGDYVDLMEHWDKVLPNKILRVHYELVVADIETQVRRLLDFCELPFEESCLRFYETKRSVRTASSEQVRQPIFQHGLEQWQNYEQFLGPLKEKLGACIDNYDGLMKEARL